MSSAPSEANSLVVSDPATGATIRELVVDTPATIAAKADAARSAQPGWAAIPLAERKAAMRRFAAEVGARAEQLALLLTSEVGKPIAQARSEIAGTLERIDFFLDHVDAAMAERTVREHQASRTREVLTRDPLGVVANISAWNYPWFVGINVIAPALLCGNSVLYKPSEHAALTGLAIAELLHAAGVPRAIFAPIVGAGPAGAALLAQDIDAVFFTGSNATGARVAEAAARRLARVQLELGGKDPVYVCEDVDPALAAAAVADGAFYNAGQSCCAVERIYVQRAIAPAFIEAFVATVRGFKLGDPKAEGTYIGPLARHAQLDVLDAQVADARSRGARSLVPGGRCQQPGNWWAPAVYDRVDHGMALMRDETFGPLVGIQVVDDDATATRLMADTAYGLTAGVYTRDEGRARRLLGALRTGTAYWNCCDRVSPFLPWSGRAGSGIGCTLGEDGIAAFTQPRAWHLRQP